jgi:hypothetical protein
MNKQSERILKALQAAKEPIAMPELSRTGSGKPDGWCASFTRRISDLRAAAHNIVVSGTSNRTFYKLIKPELKQQEFSALN